MLNINDIERSLLDATSAITVNEFGQEVLADLNLAESQFVLTTEKCGKENVSEVELQRYLNLMVRHRSARILIAARKVMPNRAN